MISELDSEDREARVNMNNSSFIASVKLFRYQFVAFFFSESLDCLYNGLNTV